MNSITQDIKFKQLIIKYSYKNIVKKLNIFASLNLLRE